MWATSRGFRTTGLLSRGSKVRVLPGAPIWPDSATRRIGSRNVATITRLTATGRNLPTEILFAGSGAFLSQPPTADSHRRPFASSPRRTDGIVVTDDQVRLGPEGNSDEAPPVPGGMRSVPWCRGRDLPRMGFRPTDIRYFDGAARLRSENQFRTMLKCVAPETWSFSVIITKRFPSRVTS
jgi:hypothetical protein